MHSFNTNLNDIYSNGISLLTREYSIFIINISLALSTLLVLHSAFPNDVNVWLSLFVFAFAFTNISGFINAMFNLKFLSNIYVKLAFLVWCIALGIVTTGLLKTLIISAIFVVVYGIYFVIYQLPLPKFFTPNIRNILKIIYFVVFWSSPLLVACLTNTSPDIVIGLLIYFIICPMYCHFADIFGLYDYPISNKDGRVK